MPSMKFLVLLAVMLVFAAAFDDTDDEVDRGRGHHGGRGRGHHGRGGRGHHRCHHHHHHHHHHHGLTFFKDLNETVREQFIEIWRDEDLSRDEKKAKINELAESVLTPEQLDEFHKNQEERARRMQEWREEMDKKIAALSPVPRAAAEKIQAIWRDHSTTGPDSWKIKKDKTEEIKATLSDADKKELESVWGHRWGRRCGGFLSSLSFYNELDQSIKDKFTAIFRNDDLNWGEKKAEINKLAQSVFTADQLKEFESMKAEHEKRKQQRRAEMDAKIATFTPNARAAAEKIRKIFDDEMLDWGEKRKQMREIKKELTDSEKAELESLRPHRFHGKHNDKSESEEKNDKDAEEPTLVSATDI